MDPTRNGHDELLVDLDAFVPQRATVVFRELRYTVTRLRSLAIRDLLEFLRLDREIGAAGLGLTEQVALMQTQISLVAPGLGALTGELSFDQLLHLRDAVLGVVGTPQEAGQGSASDGSSPSPAASTVGVQSS